VDIALGGVGVTPGREAIGDFTCPYLYFPARNEYFFAAQPGLDPIRSVIAVQSGSVQSAWLSSNGYRVREFPTLGAAVQAVISGQVGAVFGSRGAVSTASPLSDGLAEVGSLELPPAAAAFLVSDRRSDLLLLLNATLAQLHSEGFIRRAHQRWFRNEQFVQVGNHAQTCQGANRS
jgi:ABC-type amino acid transport substrate-binding protein